MQARLPYLVTMGWLFFLFFFSPLPFDYLNKKRVSRLPFLSPALSPYIRLSAKATW